MNSAERSLTLDGTTYLLIATKGSRGFHACWTCDACKRRDYCQLHESEEQAFQVASRMARWHHQIDHGGEASV
jgi:hypothetical protein